MIDRILMDSLREDANKKVIQEINEGKLTIDSDVLPAFLAANLITNTQILDILEAMAGLIAGETMEKEYIVFFLNKVREIANKEMMI